MGLVRFRHLLALRACAHHCCTSEGLVVLRDHTNRVCGVAAIVYQREQGPQHFGRKLDSKDGGEHLGEACRKARWRPTCAWGRPEAIHGVTRPRAWPLRGAPMRTRGSLHASRYLDKNTGVINGSLHISTLLFSFCIYIVCITPFCGRDSNTLAKPLLHI